MHDDICNICFSFSQALMDIFSETHFRSRLLAIHRSWFVCLLTPTFSIRLNRTLHVAYMYFAYLSLVYNMYSLSYFSMCLPKTDNEARGFGSSVKHRLMFAIYQPHAVVVSHYNTVEVDPMKE